MSDIYKTPPAVPVSELRKHSDNVFDQLTQTHILLTRQGKAAGVLVHPTVWNRVLERLDDLEATVWALEAELDIARGKSELIEVSEEGLQAWIQAADADAEAANTREKVVLGAIPAQN
jgi:hypothetical protein